MDETKEIICSHCQKSFTVSVTIESGFCLHCGTAFQCQPLPDPVSTDAMSAADRIREIYDGYIRDMQELSQKKPRTLFQSLMGQDNYGSDAIHTKNRELLVAAIEDLRVAAGGNDDDQCHEIVQLFLKKKDSTVSSLYWPLVACEQLAEPLFELVEVQQLTEIYIEYNKANPGNQSLPNQILLKKKMAEIITGKGGQVPKFGLLSRRPK